MIKIANNLVPTQSLSDTSGVEMGPPAPQVRLGKDIEPLAPWQTMGMGAGMGIPVGLLAQALINPSAGLKAYLRSALIGAGGGAAVGAAAQLDPKVRNGVSGLASPELSDLIRRHKSAAEQPHDPRSPRIPPLLNEPERRRPSAPARPAPAPKPPSQEMQVGVEGSPIRYTIGGPDSPYRTYQDLQNTVSAPVRPNDATKIRRPGISPLERYMPKVAGTR